MKQPHELFIDFEARSRFAIFCDCAVLAIAARGKRLIEAGARCRGRTIQEVYPHRFFAGIPAAIPPRPAGIALACDLAAGHMIISLSLRWFLCCGSAHRRWSCRQRLDSAGRQLGATNALHLTHSAEMRIHENVTVLQDRLTSEELTNFDPA